MRGCQRQDDGVLGRGCLQLEVERAGEPLAEREARRAVDSTAEWRVNHELHATGFVEEALEDDGVTSWQRTESRARCRQVADELHGRRRLDANFVDQPAQSRFQRAGD